MGWAAVSEGWRGLVAGVDELADRALYGLSDAELTGTLSAVQAVVSRLVAVQARLVHEAAGRGLPHRHGATGVVAWLADRLRITPAEAKRLQVLGRVLDARPRVAECALAGRMNPGQVLAIGDTLDALSVAASSTGADAAASGDDPVGLDAAVMDKAETMLAVWADQFEPTILRRLGARILDHVAPDLADEVERRRLEAEQRAAHRARALTLSPAGAGRTRLFGMLDTESAAIVHAALDPLAAPRPDAAGADLRSPAARRADALVEICRSALGGDHTTGGSAPTTLVVTVDYDTLTGQLGTGVLDTGEQLSPATVRRLACDAGLLPVALDGAGVPIDVGRARRLYSGAARAAVMLRDRGCAFPGCDRPPNWCEVHHIVSWLDGGPTTRDNGVLLCGQHHRLIHHSHWRVRLGPDHRPEFIPPTHVDPDHTPRRNPYHLRR